jgi:hypothetical protein
MYEIVKYGFRFELERNESAEMHGDWDTANFKYPLPDVIEIVAQEMEDAIEEMKKRCKSFSNNDWDWESDEEGTKGELYCGNDQDGLMLCWSMRITGRSEE